MTLSTQTIEKEKRSTSGCDFLCKGRQRFCCLNWAYDSTILTLSKKSGVNQSVTRRCVDQLLNETSAGFATELSKFFNILQYSSIFFNSE